MSHANSYFALRSRSFGVEPRGNSVFFSISCFGCEPRSDPTDLARESNNAPQGHGTASEAVLYRQEIVFRPLPSAGKLGKATLSAQGWKMSGFFPNVQAITTNPVVLAWRKSSWFCQEIQRLNALRKSTSDEEVPASGWNFDKVGHKTCRASRPEQLIRKLSEWRTA